MFKSKIVFVFKVLMIISFITPVLAETITPKQVLENYFDAAITGNWQRAEVYWSPQDIKKANRLGIKYTGQKFKYDSNSPIIQYLENIRAGVAKIDILQIDKNSDYWKATIRLISANDSIEYTYYIINANNNFYLTSRINLFTQNWNSVNTRYANVIFSDSSLINTYALKKLDEFIQKTCQTFAIPSTKMKKLEKNKIDYFLCNQNEMKLLTGYDAHGITNLQFDAIISRHLPHPHELIHLLINYSLEDLPLYTLPLLQEGLAVAYGGRWCKEPEIVMQLSPFIISENICKLRDLLSQSSFNKIMPDISYPVSGAFSHMLITNYGIDSLKKIYLLLSGSFNEIQKLTKNNIVNIFQQTYGTEWETLESDFKLHLKQFELNDLVPGISKNGKYISEFRNKNQLVTIYETDDTYEFIIKSKMPNPSGLILFKNSPKLFSEKYKSRLYNEQFPDKRYTKSEYGIIFNNKEVGFYNYSTDCLEAKHVSSFLPNMDYWDSETSTIYFSLKKSALDFEWNAYDIKLLELLTP
ncbi:MAG: hypothetical protein GY865_02295 [candidate division Zixibacteria bacterium]|nr:hypothetical protein [candidate division Zixibacteria bacterium]